ncbi:glycerate kinase [Algoriphagus iocasae]|uniref:Glycerate kinase n=1 Tax=Algoriphagus iocasae TaxID=1836499 RepID=A0A841MVT3_9BACT|nr:glycerate kinase [Algoriphagus iocasae]MBB6328176.1 glycerate kinase [Algoriphagus iocasae]
MRVLIAPNAFKGTLSGKEAGEVIASVLHDKHVNIKSHLHPIADGGDGTCQLLAESLKLIPNKVLSLNAVGRPAIGYFFKDGNRALIDVSNVSGLGELQPKELDIGLSSTYGTGILVKEAISQGCQEIVLGLGGSATIDLGIGILQALGFQFLNKNGRELVPFSSDFLFKIKHIQRSPKTAPVRFTFLCDVRNLFFGNEGAIPVFGPQKGLKISEIENYENQCEYLLDLMYRKSNRSFEDLPGFGAAGGIAAGLSAFFETKIETGATYFFEQTGLKEKVETCDLIITGEGRYDSQSKSGKACYELLKLARQFNKKIVLITSGEVSEKESFDQVLSLPDLDFNQTDLKTIARRNLVDTISGLVLK